MRLPEYGLVTELDAELIGTLLDETARSFAPEPITILEIGVREGQTGRGMARLLADRGSAYRYIGIDNNRDLGTKPPFPGAELVIGDSAEVFEKIPNALHFVLLDGCHCVNHVVLDFLHYGSKVVPGGVIVLHDADPAMQGKDYQGHGPQTPDFHVATTRGLELLALMHRPEWAPAGESMQGEWGGAVAFRRTVRTIKAPTRRQQVAR